MTLLSGDYIFHSNKGGFMFEGELFGKIMALAIMTWVYMVFKTGRL